MDTILKSRYMVYVLVSPFSVQYLSVRRYRYDIPNFKWIVVLSREVLIYRRSREVLIYCRSREVLFFTVHRGSSLKPERTIKKNKNVPKP